MSTKPTLDEVLAGPWWYIPATGGGFQSKGAEAAGVISNGTASHEATLKLKPNVCPECGEGPAIVPAPEVISFPCWHCAGPFIFGLLVAFGISAMVYLLREKN